MSTAADTWQPETAHRSLEPVPAGSRVLSGVDLAVLWGDLGIGLLVLVTGALLVPRLSFTTAIVAIVIGSLLAVGLLALVGSAGGRPTAAPLGIKSPVS